MAVLDLLACPICQAQTSLARQNTKTEGRSRITYECLECGSVVLWLGDDLWLSADRWAYQKVGRKEMAHLLRRSMTVDELRKLADRKPAAGDGKRPADGDRAATRWTWKRRSPSTPSQERGAYRWPGGLAAERDGGAEVVDVESTVVGDDEWPAEPAAARSVETQPQAPRHAAVEGMGPTVEPVPMWDPGPARATVAASAAYGEVTAGPVGATAPPMGAASIPRRRSRGSPFLVVSVVLTLLCLICSSAIMIASTSLDLRAPQGLLPAAVSTQATPTQEPLPTEAATAVDTPSPTPTDLPPPTDTPMPTPTQVSAVQFQGVTDYVSSTGSHYVVGEVVNTTGENLRFVEIMATFYDGDGQVVGTGSTFAELSIIEAGSSAPFKLATLDPPPSLASYKLRADYVTSNQAALQLEVLNHSAFVDESGWYRIVGEIRNPYDVLVKFPEIVATYYSATHQVIRVEVAFSEIDALHPGQASLFEVVLVDPPGDLHHYALQTEAVVE
jgi:hypothetical protein